MIIALTGKPSCGKSTFFKASTLAEVEISARPFTTLKSTEGEAYVKVNCVDKEFNVQCNPRFGFCLEHKRFVPIKLVDVPGLIEGSHLGKGCGNQFLDDLRQADVFIQVVDISGSTNEKGEIVEIGSYDPRNDVRFLETELNLWYFRLIKKGWERFARQVHQEQAQLDKAIAKQLSGLKVTEDMIKNCLKKDYLKKSILEWKDNELKKLASDLRKESKPMIIAANKIDVKNSYNNYLKLKEEFKDYMIIPCSAEAELALREAAKHELIEYIAGEKDFKILKDMDEKKKNALNFIKKNVLEKYNSTGVQDVLNKAVFDLLKYIAIFPGGVNKLTDKDGNILPDCFLMKDGSIALDFAYKIHEDIGKNFIKAITVRNKMAVGKDYKLKNRDVIEIKTKK